MTYEKNHQLDTFPAEIRFIHSWRPHQQRVLSELEGRLPTDAFMLLRRRAPARQLSAWKSCGGWTDRH